MEIYTVRSGDTVDSIAARTGADLASLLQVNQLEYPYRLAVGQSLLLLSAEETAKDPDPSGSLRSSGGYAYPFISQDVLEETLPYLNELSLFSYGFTAEGALIPPASDDETAAREALLHGVTPTLTLTPLDGSGHFNNNLVSSLVHSPSVQLALLRNLAAAMAEKGYLALNIDFEYILAEDRDAFTAFVKRTTDLLNQFEYTVTVALAPKNADDQPGTLYEGIDYAGLGAAANGVLLMTYEWGYSYGPPMAVAPINQVRRVVEYALTRIPAEKISLGIPNYGYDWPLPYVRGTTKASTLGNVEAVQTAVFYGAEIQFDETAQSPFFDYWQYGIRHQVWFEDVRSYQAKFSLVREYGLKGIGIWQLMRLFRAGWVLWEKMRQ